MGVEKDSELTCAGADTATFRILLEPGNHASRPPGEVHGPCCGVQVPSRTDGAFTFGPYMRNAQDQRRV